jgi:replicative DNA helicase
LGDISWGGKMIAKEFNCCVFFAQQLNRGTEERVNKRPLLSDLRDSGELEQNADQVVFLYREDYYNGNSLDISPTEVIVAKFRDGMVGSTKVMFNKARQRFYCTEVKR